MSGPGRKPTISDKRLLREIRMMPDPIVTATEIAERIDMTRQGVNNRLDELVDEGYLNEKEVGSRAIVYWLTQSGKDRAAQPC